MMRILRPHHQQARQAPLAEIEPHQRLGANPPRRLAVDRIRLRQGLAQQHLTWLRGAARAHIFMNEPRLRDAKHLAQRSQGRILLRMQALEHQAHIIDP